MMPGGCGLAVWHAHVNGCLASREMRHWLTDRVSLTVKLIAHSAHFRVHRLAQRRALCLRDEATAIGLARPMMVQEREVLLECDGVPVVYAHTAVPLAADANDWPFFGSLGERSLGTTLFGDPLVRRGALRYARLSPTHPLHVRAGRATGDAHGQPLFARRCLFRRKAGVLLVTEVFLPAIAALQLRDAGLTPARYVGGRRYSASLGIGGKRI
ncbi:MAG: chorismate lyase [Burkholderiaceae bacterium]|nr:chorismate lyase [Burkholderiaceae bacterium]